jgi:cobalt/nickel transport system ATP-binding protein
VIDIAKLTVVYPDGHKALTNVNFTAIDGTRIGVIGVNGAGKSTLLLSIIGVVPLSLGTVKVNEVELSRKSLPQLRQMVGMVFQNPDDQLFMTKVYDDVAFGLRNYGISEDEIAQKVPSILDNLGIAHLIDRAPHRLSYGEKRRVAIAGVLAMSPLAILLDEPSSFLDPRSRKQLIATLGELKQTQIIATHDIELARELCTQVIALKDGVILANDTPDIVLSDNRLLEECGL